LPDERFASAIARLAGALADVRDDWWIIGSAAVALHGGDPGGIADIDVIVSERDLEALYARLPLIDTRDESKGIFRSQRFGLWSDPDLAVEFMAGFEALLEGNWQAVLPRTRQSKNCDGAEVFVPERGELIAILEQFGRPKDLRRAAALRSI